MADKNTKKPDKSAVAETYSDYLKRRLSEITGENKGEIQKDSTKSKSAEKKDEKLRKKEKEEKSEPVNVPENDVDWKASIKNDNRSSKGQKDKQVDGESEDKKSASVLKRIGFIALAVVLVVVLIVGGYFAFLQMSFSRIEDMKYLEIQNNSSNRVMAGREYSISTFNIGFGAYDQNFSFFMDEGEMSNGTVTKGTSSRADSEENVKNNINGAISLIKSKALSDFYFFQEVDTSSNRSQFVNQVDMLREAFPEYASSYAVNSHSKFLFYPLAQPIGKMNSGIMTLSKFNVNYAIRRSLPISTGMIDKLFDLDRCFSVTKLPISGVDGKYLVLVNVHLSAYDEGDIRTEQIKMVYDYIDFEYNHNGNYVIVGGDFNLGLAGDSGIFNNSMKTPNWYKSLPDGYTKEDFAKIGFSFGYDISTTIGTCRDASIKYTQGVNLEVVIDGFITSGNVLVSAVETINGEFKNSDHNPVRMKFILN